MGPGNSLQDNVSPSDARVVYTMRKLYKDYTNTQISVFFLNNSGTLGLLIQQIMNSTTTQSYKHALELFSMERVPLGDPS